MANQSESYCLHCLCTHDGCDMRRPLGSYTAQLSATASLSRRTASWTVILELYVDHIKPSPARLCTSSGVSVSDTLHATATRPGLTNTKSCLREPTHVARDTPTYVACRDCMYLSHQSVTPSRVSRSSSSLVSFTSSTPECAALAHVCVGKLLTSDDDDAAVATVQPPSIVVVVVVFISGHRASTGGSSILFACSAGAAAFTTHPDVAGVRPGGGGKTCATGRGWKPGGTLGEGSGVGGASRLFGDSTDMLPRRGRPCCAVFFLPRAGTADRWFDRFGAAGILWLWSQDERRRVTVYPAASASSSHAFTELLKLTSLLLCDRCFVCRCLGRSAERDCCCLLQPLWCLITYPPGSSFS